MSRPAREERKPRKPRKARKPREPKAPIGCSPRDAEEETGLSHGTINTLIATGKLKSVKVRGRRIILIESLRQLLTPEAQRQP